MPGLALAQTAAAKPADRGELQAVTVTANWRVEDAQKVSVSVTAISGDTLAERNVTDLSQMGSLSAGFTSPARLQLPGWHQHGGGCQLRRRHLQQGHRQAGTGLPTQHHPTGVCHGIDRFPIRRLQLGPGDRVAAHLCARRGHGFRDWLEEPLPGQHLATEPGGLYQSAHCRAARRWSI